jgi:hypothetical protein
VHKRCSGFSIGAVRANQDPTIVVRRCRSEHNVARKEDSVEFHVEKEIVAQNCAAANGSD